MHVKCLILTIESTGGTNKFVIYLRVNFQKGARRTLAYFHHFDVLRHFFRHLQSRRYKNIRYANLFCLSPLPSFSLSLSLWGELYAFGTLYKQRFWIGPCAKSDIFQRNVLQLNVYPWVKIAKQTFWTYKNKKRPLLLKMLVWRRLKRLLSNCKRGRTDEQNIRSEL